MSAILVREEVDGKGVELIGPFDQIGDAFNYEMNASEKHKYMYTAKHVDDSLERWYAYIIQEEDQIIFGPFFTEAAALEFANKQGYAFLVKKAHEPYTKID